MNILSLFDGMACGMLAFQKAGIPVDNYYAYEIDKYAIQTATHNFPQIQECSDVFKGDYTQYEGIDYLIGGSVCTYWSIAQSPDKRETTASGLGWDLFSQYVRALREAKPKYFIYENNKSMSKEIRKAITETFGFEDICINSARVSVQNTQRLYWVGKRNADGTYSKVEVQQPEDREILLKDVLDGFAIKERSPCIDANYYKGGNYTNVKKQSGQRMCCAEPVNVTADGKAQCLRATCYKDGIRNIAGNIIDRKTGVAEPVACRCRGRTTKDGKGYAKYECREDNKSNTLDTNTTNGNMVAEPVNTTVTGKSQTLKAQYSKTDINNICKYSSTYGASGVAEPVRCFTLPREDGVQTQSKQYRVYSIDGKTNAITTVSKDNLIGTPVRVGLYPTSDGRSLDSQGMRIYSVDAKSVTQSTQGGGMGAKTGLYAVPVEFDGDVPLKAVSGADGKTYTVYEVKNGNITIKGKTYPIKLIDGYYIIRKLTVSECKRLQTVPEWYEFPVSNTRAYSMLGNGWTVDVIVHLIRATRK